MSVQIDFIKSLPYFSGLDQSGLDTVRGLVFEKKADRGELIAFEGEPADTLYFVAAGAVKTFKTSADGKEQIIDIVRPGESFNDVPVFTGGANLTSAEAMGEVLLNALKKTDLAAILRDYPLVAENAIKILEQRVARLVSLVEDLSFRNVTGRVAKILLDNMGDGAGDRPRLTQQEMAAMIGTAREMVGRALKTLEGDGNIRLDRHRIIITDREALRQVAGVNS
jgi:CRP/FNR family transcriptional regulator